VKEVDYAKLSEQYAGFLVAIGGVSITALTLVLGLSAPPTTPTEESARLFLVASLIVATVSCFIGAHMMAETAAFFTHPRSRSASGETNKTEEKTDKVELGNRLFVLATSKIFIALMLVLFAIVLLPTATGKLQIAASLKPVFDVVFVGVVLGALIWMGLAAIARTGVGAKGLWAIGAAIVLGVISAVLSAQCSKEFLLRPIFIVIVILNVASLVWFAVIFKINKADCSLKACAWEIAVFSSAITVSYAVLLVVYFKML
jgi:hypothetical protein